MKQSEELEVARVQIKSLKELIESQKHELQYYTQTQRTMQYCMNQMHTVIWNQQKQLESSDKIALAG